MVFIIGLILGLIVGAIIMDYAYFKKQKCTGSDEEKCLSEYFGYVKMFFNRLRGK